MNGKKFFNYPVFVMILICMSVSFSPQLIGADRDISISAVGDCLIFNKVSMNKDPRFLDLVEILHRADCAYGNCETTLFNAGDGFPAYKNWDPNVYCETWGADELQWLGIDLMSLANNHIMDFDYNGLFSTMENLDRVGIKHAGAGRDLAHAGKPAYFETEAGPVALISCASWFPQKNHQASRAHPYMQGRPGLNPINTQWLLQLDEENYNKMKEIRDRVYQALEVPLPEDKENKGRLDMGSNIKYSRGDEIEHILEPDKKDLERILNQVKVARRNARLVIVSLHEHLGTDKNRAPSKFQKNFARSCIDAGADMFVGTGSHQLWGIELHKGKPIFHGLGNFFFQGPIRIISPEAYMTADLPPDTRDPTLYEEKFDHYFKGVPIWESVVPFVTFDGKNNVKEILLYPIELGEGKVIYMRGTPRLSDKKQSREIIRRLEKISEPFKIRIVFQDGVGKIIL